jgi:hypothetical protein
MHEYDKCGKYLIQHRGNSILRMAGVNDIARWTPRQAEPVQHRQLPDGVLEVWSPGQAQSDIFILEIATDPDARVPSQAVRDMALVYLERGILPEVLVLFLREKGNVPAADAVELHSRRRFTKLNLSWKAIKLWEVPAEELLAMNDVGLLPWVPLAKVSGSPERIVRRCRARMDQAAPRIGQTEYENLLVVTQFLLPLRYNEDLTLLERLRALLGGRQVMIESPLYQEIVEESERKGEIKARQQDIMDVLLRRFGPPAQALKVELNAVEFDRLRDLLGFAVSCRSLASFRKQLLS